MRIIFFSKYSKFDVDFRYAAKKRRKVRLSYFEFKLPEEKIPVVEMKQV